VKGRGIKISRTFTTGERRGAITHKNGISNRVYQRNQTFSNEFKRGRR